MKKTTYTAFIAAFGSALEYYSFITYIMLSPILGDLFFPASNQHAKILYTLAIFAAGYLCAPLSAVGSGFIADRIGRKQIMVIALFMMAAATFLMGLLPTYQTIGISATIALVLLRMIQGLAQGAELPGAITFISEHANEKNQARYCSTLFFAVGMGALLSTLINYLLTHFLSKTEMLAYGWRIPFLLAGTLGIVGYLIRKNTEETPLFVTQKNIEIASAPIFTLLKEYFPQVINGCGLVFGGATLINFGLFLPSFLQMHFGFSSGSTYLAMTSAFALDFLLVFFGMLADKITLKKFYLIGVIIDLICIYPIFCLLKLNSIFALYAFCMSYQLLILLLAANYPSMLARLFPTKIRYSGVSLSYISIYSLAGLVPLIVNSVYTYFSSIFAVASFLFSALLISLIAGIYYKNDSKYLKLQLP